MLTACAQHLPDALSNQHRHLLYLLARLQLPPKIAHRHNPLPVPLDLHLQLVPREHLPLSDQDTSGRLRYSTHPACTLLRRSNSTTSPSSLESSLMLLAANTQSWLLANSTVPKHCRSIFRRRARNVFPFTRWSIF